MVAIQRRDTGLWALLGGMGVVVCVCVGKGTTTTVDVKLCTLYCNYFVDSCFVFFSYVGGRDSAQGYGIVGPTGGHGRRGGSSERDRTARVHRGGGSRVFQGG